MIEKAIIDRFEGKQAVLLIDEKPLIVLRTLLPDKVKEGDWLDVEIVDGQLRNATIDPEEKARAEARIAEKLAMLRKRII
jgi:hypothetical protein